MSELVFNAGHVFFHSGDSGNQAFLLNQGQVELLTGTAEPFSRVALFEPGDVFGDMALIEERPRLYTARAVTAGRATPMTRDEFEHQLAQVPGSIRQHLTSLFERLRSLTARLADEGEPVHTGTTNVPVLVERPGRPAPIEFPQVHGRPARWVVIVHPLTRKAAQTLPDEGLLITRFPLRIGRATAPDEKEALDLNDLWLLDEKPYTVSRNHCEIDVTYDGPLVRDRGSYLGCFVNHKAIGGQSRTSYARLDSGDNVLAIGSGGSPYQFRLFVRPA